MRTLKYVEAIKEAHFQALETDKKVFVIGQGVDNPWCVGTSTKGLLQKFGADRVRDVPISENGMTGAAIGAAMAGMRPLVFHPRMDFMYLAMDQIFNHCANWHYMFNGQIKVPVTIRGIINRGNEQAAQHSQSPYSMYAHVPGLKIVTPATPYDAKGLLLASIFDDNPVLYIDDRWLYEVEGSVPEKFYTSPIGKGKIVRTGSDLTIVAISYLVQESIQAAKELEKENISVEIIDLRSIKPLDINIIIKSVKKTKKLLIADPAWPMCSIASEISTKIYDKAYNILKSPIIRINLPECHAPASTSLEKSYYPKKTNLIKRIKDIYRKKEK